MQSTIFLYFFRSVYRSLLASRSDSMRQRMSFSRTGPLTLRTIDLEVSSMNSTRTWVTPPLEPVLPRTLMTLASLTGVLVSLLVKRFWHIGGCWLQADLPFCECWGRDGCEICLWVGTLICWSLTMMGNQGGKGHTLKLVVGVTVTSLGLSWKLRLGNPKL